MLHEWSNLEFPSSKHRHDHELHATNLAMNAIAFTASKVIRFPTLQRELKPFIGTLCRSRQHPRLTEIAAIEAPKVR